MKDQNKFLPLIAGFKILKALSLFALAIGLHHLRVGNSEAIILNWCKEIRVDSENKYLHLFISKVTGMPERRLRELSIGTFFYGLLFGVEGVGLLLRQRWAEYLTVISTVTFLPLEIYELLHPGRRAVKAVVLVINVGIVIYLAVNLRENKSQLPAEPTPAA